VKLRDAQSILVQAYLKKNQRKREVDKDVEVTKFSVRDYVLQTYPNRPPNKLARMYLRSIGNGSSGQSQRFDH